MKGAGVRINLDTKGLDALVAELIAAKSLEASAGIHAREAGRKYPNGATVGEVAIYQEFGTRDIPARSFIRRTYYTAQDAIGREAVRAFRKVGRTVERRGDAPRFMFARALSEVAAFASDQILATVDTARNWAKGNAKSTIAKKGFDLPLIDTGELRGSITWEVRSKGREYKRGKAR